MGKQAATKVRAGAKGTGAAEEIFSAAPTLRLVSSPKRQRILEGMLEVVGSNGYVSMEAQHYSRAVATAPIRWTRIPDLGRTLSGMTAEPVSMASQTPGAGSARLEYRMWLLDSGAVTVRAYLSPTLNFSGAAHGLRYAMSIDDETPQIVNVSADSSLRAWEQSVADNITIGATRHQVGDEGAVVYFKTADGYDSLMRLNRNGQFDTTFGLPDGPGLRKG